jgi:hypothetical protein
MSVIDLVIKHQELEPSRGLKEATDWICAHWNVPTIAKNAKLSRPQRWASSPVGLSSFPLEEFVRSGMWAALDDAGRAVLPALFCFAEKGEVCVSYRALSRYAGKASDATIAKALHRFKQIGILEALPKAGSNFREAGRYHFTLDSLKFQAALSELHARLKLERDEERELRAQSRTAALPRKDRERVATRAASYPGTTTLYTRVKCEQSAHYSAVKCEERDIAEEERPISEGALTENKATWETPHYTIVKCEGEPVPNEVALSEKLARSVATARRWREIAGATRPVHFSNLVKPQ